MSISSIRFACSRLDGTAKRGIILPDAEGNYEQVVGGLNVFNSAGQFYVYEQVRELFENSSQLMRRVNRGVVKGELGHPKQEPGQDDDSYARRILSIEETNVCCIHKEIRIDFDSVKDANGNPVIAIMSKISPSGPHGEQLKRSFENPGENVCFSIRAFTDDYRDRGITKRILRNVVTWDQVTEPGISIAEKFMSPTLEDYFEKTFSKQVMLRGLKQAEKLGVASESTIITADDFFSSVGWDRPSAGAKPSFLEW